ncbi:MAG: response regulator [Methanomicrobiales archaeon]
MSDKRILIVEDDAIVAMTIEDSLHEMGYSVVGRAANANDAIKIAEDEKPDLILMDIRIQGDRDGIEAASEINRSNNIPIIYLTAYSDNETIRRAAKTQPYGFLTKPFRQKEMYSTIEIALYKHRILRRKDLSGTREPATMGEVEQNRQEGLEKTVLDRVGMPVFVLSRDMKLVFFNKPLENFFRKAGCLEVRLNRSVFEIAPASLIGSPKDYRVVFESNRLTRIEKTIIVDGRKIIIGIIIVPISEGETTPGHVTAVIKDISREHAAEEKIKEMYTYYDSLLIKIGDIMKITRRKEDKDMKEISDLVGEIVITIAQMDPRRWRSP